MTGRPRSSGWSRCSTAAKNASRSTWRIVRSGTLAIIDPLWKPPPAAVAGARSRRPRHRPDRRASSSRGAAPVACHRPRLAVPVRRSGLGHRPARRAGPAGPGPGRRRGRRERVPVGPPRRPRRARRRVRAGRRSPRRHPVDRRRHPGPRRRPPSVAGTRRPVRRVAGIRRLDPRPTRAAWLIAAVVGLGASRSSCSRTAGARRPTAGSPAAGTGATCWSTSRSAPASCTATSRRRCPTSPATPLTYHWFADFHGAIASSVAGIDLIPVYFATSAVFAAVMALLVWTLALRLTGDRRVATIADDPRLPRRRHGLAPPRRRRARRATPTSTWVAPDPVPVRQHAGRTAGRSSGSRPCSARASCRTGRRRSGSLGWSPRCCSSSRASAGARPASCWRACIAALLAPFQFYAFPATYLIVGLYVVTTGAWRAPTARRDAALFLGPLILAVPFIADAVFQQSQVGAFRFVAGWSEARFGQGPLAVLFFYATNLGHPVRAGARRGRDGLARPAGAAGSSSPGSSRSS